MINQTEIFQLNNELEKATAEEIIVFFISKFKNKISFATSFSVEDQVITDMVFSSNLHVNIFTLDTGRLFPETYSVLDRTNMRYYIKIDAFFPDYNEVEKMVKENGINLFYESIDKRKLCCRVRKTNPLNRALKDKDAWICGLRKEQSVTRKEIQIVEWDKQHNMFKINPLINWTEKEVFDYIKRKHVPYNKLYDKNFRSIGCQPCTRSVEKGNDVRSGRWWWEDPEHKECGLHRK